MMRAIYYAILVTYVYAGSAGSQELEATIDLANPQYPVAVSLPDALENSGSTEDLNLNFLTSRSGAVMGLSGAIAGARAGSLCTPICWGDPPRQQCIFPVGCPELGGSGGGGVMLQAPLLVEISPTETDAGELKFDLSVRDLSEIGVNSEKNFEYKIIGLPQQ